MLAQLTSNPFTMKAHFEFSLVLCFVVPKEEVEALIPTEIFSLDLVDENHAAVAVACVSTSQLRPRWMPKKMGNEFFLTGYRTFVYYKTKSGKRRRGLYILASETDKKSMVLLGNLFSRYNYNYLKLDVERTEENINISSKHGLQITSKAEKHQFTGNDFFKTEQQAKRFAGPLPWTFHFNKKQNAVSMVRGIRKNWNPKFVEVTNYQIPKLNEIGIQHATYSHSFFISNIDYQWNKSEIDQL